MRRRYRWDAKACQMVEVPWNDIQIALAPVVWDDLPEYASPVTGKSVAGRRQRREDLKRTHSRPYEGREQEMQVAMRHRSELERKEEALIDRMAHQLWAEAPERYRKLFRSK